MQRKICLEFNVFTQSLHHNQNVTQGQFLSGVQVVWIHFSFL